MENWSKLANMQMLASFAKKIIRNFFGGYGNDITSEQQMGIICFK